MPKSSFITDLINNLSGRTRLLAEKDRLEAFLAAFPGNYCGWGPDGTVAYNPEFAKVLGLNHIKSVADIHNTLAISDSATLEGSFNRLKHEGIPFRINAHNYNQDKVFQISGSRGYAINGRDHFNILWLEDISPQALLDDQNQKHLKNREERVIKLEKSLSLLPYPLWKRDQDQKITWCNSAYARTVGASIDDVLHDQKELPPASRKKKKGEECFLPAGAELAAKALKENSTANTKLHVIAEGKRLLMRVTEYPVPGHNSTVGFAEDITELEELENALKRYQATNHELLGQLRTAIGIFGLDQRLEFYNAAFSQLWGIEEKWLNNQPKLGDLMEKLRENRRLPEQADFRRFKQSWLGMFTALIEPHEDMLYTPDGSALRMLVVPQSAGGLMMTFEDVTSRLELESSYNTLIAVQKETLDNLAEGVAVYGGDGRLKLWNPSFARLWGLHPEDLEGEPHINMIVEKQKAYFTKEEWPQKREELMAKGLERIMHEGRMKRANETLVDFATVPLPDGGVLVTYTDVTDSVRVENALREKNAALETAEKLKIDFLANVSYQLRTPLNAIMGFNDILDQEYFGPLNTRQKDYTGDIRSASERLLGLINDILDLSTIEAGYMNLEREEVDIAQTLESVQDLARDWARKGKVEISLDCPKSIGMISADSRRLKQALMNIIRNSIAFTPSGGRIDITAKKQVEGIKIAIADTGIGISRENHSRIFEPFEKAQRGGQTVDNDGDNMFRGKGGAGLGLSLVKHIISLHGGAVDLKSEINAGTTVSIFLPYETASDVKPIKMKKALSFQ